MPRLVGPLTLVLLIGLVVTRVGLLRRQGVQAMNFGKIDRSDFLIPPFALAYFYLIFAAGFGWPSPSTQRFFETTEVSWVGVGFCLMGLTLLSWSLVSFGRSFRVGIDIEHPDRLITTGVFGRSRNPIYVAFACILLGQFLLFSNWIVLVYLIAGTWLFHRQVLREEDYLRGHYGQAYVDYCNRVRRYV